jgi:hypothetical protein
MRPASHIPLPLLGVLFAIAATCGPRGPGGAESDASRFSFHADRVPVGTAFHYVKSNIDGTQAIRVTVYVADTARLEVAKLEPEQRAGALVVAHLDWGTYSADTLTSMHLSPDAPPRPQALAWITSDGRFVAEIGGRRDTIAVPQFPVHVYNFDFLSLAQLFAHLRDPEGAFTIGVVNPVFAEGPRLLSFDGVATVRFAGEVPCHAAICRRYEVSGPGLRGARGAITVHRELGHVQSMEIPLPDNPTWRDFKLELQRVEPMDRAAWERWVVAEVAKL